MAKLRCAGGSLGGLTLLGDWGNMEHPWLQKSTQTNRRWEWKARPLENQLNKLDKQANKQLMPGKMLGLSPIVTDLELLLSMRSEGIRKQLNYWLGRCHSRGLLEKLHRVLSPIFISRQMLLWPYKKLQKVIWLVLWKTQICVLFMPIM